MDPKDELLKKFSKNFRKIMESRENILEQKPKTVKFNPETMEQSIGGTQTSGRTYLNESSMSSILSTSSASFIHSPEQQRCTSHVNGEANHTPRRKSENTLKDNILSTEMKAPHRNFQATPNRFLRRHTMDEPPGTPECFNPVTFETPIAKGKHHLSFSHDMEEENGSGVTVAVRVRPFSKREVSEDGTKCVLSMLDNETTVTSDSGMTYRFTYDYSFWSFDQIGGQFASQEHVYNSLAQPMLGRAFEGYNVCLFAYGQTGSGKSYSIMGHGSEVGVIPRFCEELFGRIDASTVETTNMNVEISFFEIYNEKIHDLLGPSHKDKSTGKKQSLKVREHPLLGPFVEGLSSYVIKSFEDVKGWLNVGNKHRATAATGMNDKSSRSHSVFTMVLTQTRTDHIEGEDHQHSITSKINLVDLAGSERQSQAKTSGDRLREGASINKSLHTLGKVISLLSEQSQSTNKKKKVFIPYRDSVLTWLLKENMGGNSKTAMLATVSPSNHHIEETLSTLRYAKQARTIINQAKVNEDPKARLIRELRAEIENLKCQTGGVGSEDIVSASLAEIASLREQLQDKEKAMAEMTRSWQEKMTRSEQRKLEESRLLEKSGISFKVDNKRPNLVNLTEDPQLSETLLYMLKDGQTKVGRMTDHSVHDIKLMGPLIADNHCTINNVADIVSVSPIGDALTYVNGNQITKPTVLHHGDRVILGGDHYFRFNHPSEKGRKSITSGQPGQVKDYEFARQELIQVQNEKLQAELEEAKKKHQEEMEAELERQKTAAQRQMNKELERKKQEADMELNMQKSEYEDKLADLNKLLQEYKQQTAESKQDQEKAAHMIHKLEQQKMMLEQEVLANRKRLQMEAKAAAESAVKESRENHFKIVEQLEKEKRKIAEDVQRLEVMRLRRGSAPSTPRLTPLRTPLQDSTKKDLYRMALRLREANKISQYLKKDVSFVREDVMDGEKPRILVKVTNTKLGISTFWPVEKFENRLIQMRELYQQADTDSSNPEESDEVFQNPDDMWEKEDRLGSTPNITPKLLKSQRRRSSIANTALRLSFDSTSTGTPSSAKKDPMNKIGSAAIKEEPEMESTPSSPQGGTTVPIVGMCRDLISVTLDRFKGSTFDESLSDKMLCNCELVKTGVTNILDSYNQASEMSPADKATFLDSEVVQANSIQLTSSINCLLTVCSLWAGNYESLSSGLVRDLCAKIVTLVTKLANHLGLFLQGCENDVDSLVQESASQCLDAVFGLCKLCGELSLATETSMITLRDSQDQGMAVDDEEEDIGYKLGPDIRQSFLAGCDVFVDKTVQGGLRTVEDCEVRIQGYMDELDSQNCSEGSIQDVAKNITKEIEVVTACSKILLQKCQQVQVELDSTMHESVLSESKPDNYYYRSYCRSQGVILHISNLTDGVSLLTQVTELLVKDQEEGSVKKVYRCAEMIQKSSVKLLATSNCDPASNANLSDNQSELSEVSILSDGQMEQLDLAAQDVKCSTSTLMTLIKKLFEGGSGSNGSGKSKRMLPVSPDKATKIIRRDSLKSKNIKRNVSLAEANTNR